MSCGNTYGKIFKITTFGESHGKGVGVVVDGCPSNIPIDTNYIQEQLNRRKPGQSRMTTQRKELDEVEILSGIAGGLTLGTPICLLIRNKDQNSQDYNEVATKFRPSHADATYHAKYGIRAVEGGGRSSARETVGRVAAGAIAAKILRMYCEMEIVAYVKGVQEITFESTSMFHDTVTQDLVDSNIMRCPNSEVASKMIERVDLIRRSGDSVGGVIEVVVRNVPAGIGDPVFDKLEAELAKACMSIPATKGFQIGSGFDGTMLTGSEHNDEFHIDENGRISFCRTKTNRSGGIQGGISNGENIIIRVAFKPTSTISKKQNTVSIDGNECSLTVKGRHDPCVLPRAVPIVEGMVATVLLDFLLRQHSYSTLFENSNPASNLGRKLKGMGKLFNRAS